MKKKKYLPLYYKWMKSGCLPDIGLCHSLKIYHEPQNELFELMRPDSSRTLIPMYWGYSGDYFTIEYRSISEYAKRKSFTPLRQNIVLFLAAMNNELDEEPRGGGMKKGKKED